MKDILAKLAALSSAPTKQLNEVAVNEISRKSVGAYKKAATDDLNKVQAKHDADSKDGWHYQDSQDEHNAWEHMHKRKQGLKRANGEQVTGVDESVVATEELVGEATPPTDNPMTKKYPDNKAGVLAYMQYGYNKSFLKRLDLPTCEIHPDPQVEGVWAVDSMASGYRCIVYLAGYRDPWGEAREHNDNEEGGLPMKKMKQLAQSGDLTPKLMKHWAKCGSLDDADMATLMKIYDDHNNWGESVDPMVDEAQNHMGEQEYGSFHGWRAACKKAGADWFDGDLDIAQAMKGPKPYVRGVTHSIGEWDGNTGSVYHQDTAAPNLPALGESEERGPAFGKRDWDAESENKPHDKYLAYKAKGGKLSRKQWEEDKDNGAEDVNEAKADPTGSWIAYKSPTEFKKYLTRDGAKKKVAASEGWKIASSEHFYDTIKKKKEVNEMWGDSDHAPDKMSKRDEKKYVAKLKARNTKPKKEEPKKTNEGKVMSSYKVVMEGQSFSVQNVHLAKILRRFPHELAVFRMEGDLDDHLYEALFDHYFDEGEMPYGTAKARDGDPYEWVSDRLAKEIGGGGSSVGHPADKADYMGMGEVDEAMSPFQQQRANSMASKSKDDVWAKAKAAVDSGGTANPFKAKTPAEHNPAFNGGERAGKATAGAGAWSGNFESVGEDAAGGREVDYSTVEIDGVHKWDRPDFADAYISYAEYTDGTPLSDDELEAFNNDNGDLVNQLANEQSFGESIGEDSVAPEVEPGEELITEGLESVVTDILTNVGLDHGLDFFFDDGLVVIGRSTARVVINALKADHRITSAPSIESCDGEECRITFGQTPDESINTPEPELQLSSKVNKGKKIAEDVNLSITADGQDDVVNVIRKLSGLGADSVEADMSPLSITTSEPVPSVGAGSDMSSMIGALDAIDGSGDPVDDEQADIVSHSGGAANDDLDETEYDNEPDPQVYATTQQQMNFGDKSQQGRSKPMTQPGNNPMAEARSLMRQYESMLRVVKAK